MCENDPRLPNSTCIENLKRPQFPQRKPHSVHFSKIEYAILILTLIDENFSAALEFLPLVYSVSSIFCLEFSINVLLFISDGASNSSPQIPSSRIRKSKSLFLPIKNILTEPENTVLAPDTDELVAEWAVGRNRKLVLFAFKLLIEDFINALFDIWYQSSGAEYEMSQIWVSMIGMIHSDALSKLNCTHTGGVSPSTNWMCLRISNLNLAGGSFCSPVK